MTTIHPPTAGQSPPPDAPAAGGSVAESFSRQLSQAQTDQDAGTQVRVAQAASEAVGAQAPDPAAPPLPPPPPPSIPEAQPPAVETPTVVDATPPGATASGTGSSGAVQTSSGASDDDGGFGGAGATTGTTESGTAGGSALLTSLVLPPALQRIIREARRFVPGDATLHIFSTAHGWFRGRFAVPQSGVLNSTPPAPPPVVGSPRTLPDSGTPATRSIDDPQPPAPPAAPPGPGRLQPGASPAAAADSTG